MILVAILYHGRCRNMGRGGAKPTKNLVQEPHFHVKQTPFLFGDGTKRKGNFHSFAEKCISIDPQDPLVAHLRTSN